MAWKTKNKPVKVETPEEAAVTSFFTCNYCKSINEKKNLCNKFELKLSESEFSKNFIARPKKCMEEKGYESAFVD